MESLKEQQYPILHAAILSKAPSRVIKSIISQFNYSVLKTDSLDRYPIVVAMEESLDWDEGLHEIIEATAISQQQHSSIFAAAQYGLKWANQMKEQAEANADEIMNNYDDLTGLNLFMLAAMNDCHDLSAIYGLMKMTPEEKIRFGSCRSRKRELTK